MPGGSRNYIESDTSCELPQTHHGHAHHLAKHLRVRAAGHPYSERRRRMSAGRTPPKGRPRRQQATKAAAKTAPNRFDVGVRGGTRSGPTHTPVHDWVLFANISATAKALYAILRSHVNDRRGDDLTWTSSEALAMILMYHRGGQVVSYSRGDKISVFEKELIALGAIAIDIVGVPAKKYYTVEMFPPRGYAGPVSPAEWYARNGSAVTARLEADARDREERRAKAKAKKAAPETTSLVPPHGGEQAPPDGGGLAAPSSGELAPPNRGRETTLGVTAGDRGTLRTPSAPSKSATHATKTADQQNPMTSPETTNQETAEYVKSDAHWPVLTSVEQTLLDEVATAAPLWSTRLLRKVIGSAAVREVGQRDAELVRRAFLIGARDPFTVPMRMWHIAECPHWRDAMTQLADERGTSPSSPHASDPKTNGRQLAEENRARVAAAVAEHEARRSSAKPASTAPKPRVKPRQEPSEDAHARAETDEARARMAAALMAAYPAEFPPRPGSDAGLGAQDGPVVEVLGASVPA
ncbi:hypothetical protein [Actinoplanes sp. NBRC 101535]|uniref:hypothetical protein n=1 Tax=Actinoplanes sp. NBRC 101535 TaxID=3032196 RepID=UPI0024A19582|nr:hypothetical protein [Actinoplanes sp. NBRC 101535]GLY08322.1 hypothetical protein Acsp01_87010 [Actinoplanes sp. NBRC 101535]